MNAEKIEIRRYLNSLQVFELFDLIELFSNIAFVFNLDLDLSGHSRVYGFGARCQGFDRSLPQFSALQ